MSKVLNLSLELALPLNAVTEKLAWLGRTGSGKTYGGMKLAELMLNAGAQIGALDPVGVWRALRVPVAKDGAAFEVVVFGGLYGDLPLEPTAAAGGLVADLVCDRGFSFVLDVSQFIPAEQQRFVHAFADRFFHRKKSKPSAVHLFMEECQEFIPENPSGLEAMTLGVMQRLWKLGRNFGIGGSLISQRPQEIAKKALNMSGTLFAFQMTGPQERKAIKAWVADHGVAVDIESVLQKLEVGQPHVESPTFLQVSKTIRILPRVTADLSSTPEVGVSKASSRPLTPIDIEQLKTSMAATIERAKSEDPKELRARIRQLEQEMKKARGPVAVPAPKTMDERTGEPIMVAEPIAREIQRGAAGRTLAADGRSRAAVPQPAPRQGNGDARIGNTGARRMLIALAQYPQGLTYSKLAILSGISRNGGTWRTYIGQLRSAGYAEGGDPVRITEAGLVALGEYEPLPEGQALVDYWRAKLGDTGKRRIFDAVVAAYPRALTYDEVGEATGIAPAGGTWRTYVGELRTLDLVRGRGDLRASEELFG